MSEEANEGTIVWVVGRVFRADRRQWEIIAVMTDKDKAIARCKDCDMFVGPMKLDDEMEYSNEHAWEGCVFPLLKTFPLETLLESVCPLK